MNKKLGLLVVKIFALTFSMHAQCWQCGENFTDTRDGQVYRTVMINNLCWMAENLNIGIPISDTLTQANNGIIEKYCFGNINTNCDSLGGLYQWNEMMKFESIESTEGVCPLGWHIPSDTEWKSAEMFLGMSQISADSNNTFRGTNQGAILLPSSSFGFDILYSGVFNGCGHYFDGLGGYSLFWTSSIDSGQGYEFRRGFYYFDGLSYYDTNKIYRGSGNVLCSNEYGYAVRCVRDLDTIQTIYKVERNAYICLGESFFVGGELQSVPGIYFDTLHSILGCDTLLSTNLHVYNLSFSQLDTTILFGDSILIGGAFQHSAGVYYDTLSNTKGCDSIISTNLRVDSCAQMQISIDITNASIFGGGEIIVNVFGNNPPYLFSLDSVNFQSSNIFNSLDSGTYSILILDSIGCTEKRNFVVSYDTTLSVETLNKLNSVRVFPNPFSNEISIQLNANGNIYVRLVNVLGETIFTQKITNDLNVNLNTTKIPNGIYYLEILTEKGEMQSDPFLLIKIQ